LIHKPEVLFLDEPTTGVDPVSRKEFWEMLERLKTNGITILVSTPYMDEANLCDKIALMQEGKLLSIDTPGAITKQFPHKLLAISSNKKYMLLRDLEDYKFANSVYSFGEFLHYTSTEKNIDTELIKNYLQEKGHTDIYIEPVEATIEDSFMELMRKQTEKQENERR
jgi:ABC-2 type transport system ATP-binding protein